MAGLPEDCDAGDSADNLASRLTSILASRVCRRPDAASGIVSEVAVTRSPIVLLGSLACRKIYEQAAPVVHRKR